MLWHNNIHKMYYVSNFAYIKEYRIIHKNFTLKQRYDKNMSKKLTRTFYLGVCHWKICYNNITRCYHGYENKKSEIKKREKKTPHDLATPPLF